MDKIKNIKAFEILNAKGNPTVEVELTTEEGYVATASVPSGTSTGSYEAYVLNDGESRYGGKGVRKAVDNVNSIIAPALCGHNLDSQEEIDNMMIQLDGTFNKARLGANSILPVSVAFAKARALSMREPLYANLVKKDRYVLPDVIATMVSGGEFSPSGLDFEDYLYIFHSFPSFDKQMEAIVKLRKSLEKELVGRYGAFPEDGGALAPPLSSTEEAFEVMLKVRDSLDLSDNVTLGLDVAASELYESEEKKYRCKGLMDSKTLAGYYRELIDKYPLTYVEDGFDEDDIEGFRYFSQLLPPAIQNVGDDLFTSNIGRLEAYSSVANGLLLKINQIGSVSEAIKAANYAKEHGMDVTVSLRSGETCDNFIADLAVAIGAKQIKLGSPVRAERNAKYNRLLRIAEELEG